MAYNKEAVALRDKLREKFGDSAVVFASDIEPYEVVSTGSIALDFATGIAGIPNNRVVTIYGPSGVGKSTLAHNTVGNFLKKYPDKFALYLDMEGRVDKSWVSNFVADVDRVLVVKAGTIEKARDVYMEALKTGEICIAVIDSVGGAASEQEVSKSGTETVFAGNSKGVTSFSRLASAYSDLYRVCTIFINQLRDNLKPMSFKDVKPGGRGLEYATSIEVRLKPGKGDIKDKIDGEEVKVGYPVVATIMKNSLAPPYRTGTYWFYNVPNRYGEVGVDRLEETVRMGVTLDIVRKAGGWYNHDHLPGGKVQGEAKVTQFYRENPDKMEELAQQVADTLTQQNGSGVLGTYDPDTGHGEYDFTHTREVE